MPINAERRDRICLWGRLALIGLALLAMVILSSVHADVRSTNGTINFDTNFDGVAEAVLNGTGFGLGLTTPSANLQVAGNAIVSGTMVVGGTSNTSGSNLHVSGSWGFSVQTVTSNTTLSGNSVVLADTSAGNITLTLPGAFTVSGRMYTVKKTSNSHSVLLRWIGGAVLELTSGTSSYPSAQVISDGSTWHVIGQSQVGLSSSGAQYLIVDVSGGPTAVSYPVSYQATVPDLTGSGNLEFKTSKIVLKWIEPGRFTMGNTTLAGSMEHPVVLTQGFWAGVFEVTQQQWLNVMGSYPSGAQDFYNAAAGNTMPLHQVNWSEIRGTGALYDWPTTSAVSANTFMGNLLAKTGLPFDLPTEAEWEYTCRAGTATGYSFGSATGTNYSWINTNAGNTTQEVGGKLPNPWGLYDLHGNVSEWCRDWYAAYPTSSEQIDPSGNTLGTYRVFRGGHFSNNQHVTQSAYRFYGHHNNRVNYLGLRLFLKPR